jgi:aminoglycoside 3-N-acetyltransferase
VARRALRHPQDVCRLVHSRASLVADLRALGLAPGDVVMAHASLRAIGEVAGGPDEVHLAIMDVVGPTGTLFMYASCPRYVDEVGRGNLTPREEAEVLEKLPPFDATTARSARDNGALVELLRTWPGTRVNRHPARFAVRGAHADHLLSEQPWDFAFGHGSLLERFTALDGRILLLGSDHDNVTYLHYTEHVADFPDKRVVRFRVPVGEDGRRTWREMAEVDTSVGAHANWPPTIFERIVDAHLAATRNRGGPVGNATSWLIRARELHAFASEVMVAVAADARAVDQLLPAAHD